MLHRTQVSVVDQRPQELLAAAATGIRVRYAAGLGVGADCDSLRASIEGVQIDDEIFGTRCARQRAPRVQGYRVPPDTLKQQWLCLSVCTQRDNERFSEQSARAAAPHQQCASRAGLCTFIIL